MVIHIQLTFLTWATVFQSVFGINSWISKEIDDALDSSDKVVATEDGSSPYIATYLQEMKSNPDFNGEVKWAILLAEPFKIQGIFFS